MNQEYAAATKEGYLPEECEFYGFNEVGGLIFINGFWKDHCQRYKDQKDIA